MSIRYAEERDLTPEDYVAVLGSTYMGARRPIANLPRIATILENSELIVTARAEDGRIVGVARGITDGDWVCYLADLCVHGEWQRRGIGRGLLETCYAVLGPRVGLVLMAFPEAADYYRSIGMQEMSGFYHERADAS